jgi:probable HAF family extracellular repeat protein
MTSFKVLRNFTSIALTACCAIGVSSALAQTYNVTDLGVLPDQKDSFSAPAALNNQTQVAGTSGTSAFRYTKEKPPMEDVGGDPTGSITRGMGINGSGQVVGDSTFGKEQSIAALFSNGLTFNLGTLPLGGSYSQANGINALSQVVGSSSDQRDGNNSRAFIVNTADRFGRMIDLGTLGGAFAQALGINDAGFVTGNSSFGDTRAVHAFIWHAKTGMVDLGTLDGDFSYGTAINANKHVVGYSTINNYDDRTHAFLSKGEVMIDLGSLGGAGVGYDGSIALGINATDQVVGHSYLPTDMGAGSIKPLSVAFIYQNGLMVNLNDLIGTAAEKYRLDSATAINDNGEIVAIAFNKAADSFHAVLLTPNSSVPAKQ